MTAAQAPAVRVYVPATVDLLRSWMERGLVPADGPERVVAGAEDEESEYAALRAAAEDSAALGAPRRVVVVAEVADPDADFGTERLVALHADLVDHADPEDELGWYAVQEIPGLLSS